MAESLDALFAFKHALQPQLNEVPHVVEDLPVVCAWYPSAGIAAMWNLSDRNQVTLTYKNKLHPVDVAPLDMVLVEGLG